MGEWGKEGITRPGEKGNGERGASTPSFPHSPISQPHVKTRSKTLLFGLLVKEGAVLQSVIHITMFIVHNCKYNWATVDCRIQHALKEIFYWGFPDP